MSITQSGKTGFCKSTKKIFHHMGTNVCAKVFVVFIFSLWHIAKLHNFGYTVDFTLVKWSKESKPTSNVIKITYEVLWR